MKVRPILFNGPMVRALLDGTKMQTRRIIKPQPIIRGDYDIPHFGDDNIARNPLGHFRWAAGHEDADSYRYFDCPYGKPGDLLWVRESWSINMRASGLLKMFYKAHQNASHTEMYKVIPIDDISAKYQPTWTRFKPSIHMPRWASRVTLEITGVRVELLQAISRGDSMDEGCPFPNMAKGPDPREWYRDLWSSINGQTSWDANPWVWVIEFKVHKKNVDELLRQREAA